MPKKKPAMTKADAEHRLMTIAFEFQDVLLSLVHETQFSFQKRYTPKKAEALADEIQALSHFFEGEG